MSAGRVKQVEFFIAVTELKPQESLTFLASPSVKVLRALANVGIHPRRAPSSVQALVAVARRSAVPRHPSGVRSQRHQVFGQGVAVHHDLLDGAVQARTDARGATQRI